MQAVSVMERSVVMAASVAVGSFMRSVGAGMTGAFAVAAAVRSVGTMGAVRTAGFSVSGVLVKMRRKFSSQFAELSGFLVREAG